MIPGIGYAQKIDASVGVIMPWFTHGALDEIASWDLKDKTVFEWGGGYSTLWWAKKCKKVFTVEAHREWYDWLCQQKIDNAVLRCAWPDQPAYLDTDVGERVDIAVIDASDRTNCLKKALAMPRPLTLIFDNWQQDYVFIDEEAAALMEPYREHGHFYIQADHSDHQGRPWQTAIWRLP